MKDQIGGEIKFSDLIKDLRSGLLANVLKKHKSINVFEISGGENGELVLVKLQQLSKYYDIDIYPDAIIIRNSKSDYLGLVSGSNIYIADNGKEFKKFQGLTEIKGFAYV